MRTVYESLVAADCEIDHHESDLYVKATRTAERIISAHPCSARRFVADDGSGLWWELPFMYDPFWRPKTL